MKQRRFCGLPDRPRESGLGDRTSTGADRERCDTCGKDRARARDGGRGANDDAEHCRQIGLHGLELIDAIAARKNGQPVNILTHCNAGWLACVDYGSATLRFTRRTIAASRFMFGG